VLFFVEMASRFDQIAIPDRDREKNNTILIDLVKRKLKKFGMVIKLKKKPGDLNSPISPISKTSLFGEGFKNDSTTDKEIENELNLIFRGDLSSFWQILKN
jgi:hypothetical protein